MLRQAALTLLTLKGLLLDFATPPWRQSSNNSRLFHTLINAPVQHPQKHRGRDQDPQRVSNPPHPPPSLKRLSLGKCLDKLLSHYLLSKVCFWILLLPRESSRVTIPDCSILLSMPLCNTLKNIDLEQARYHPEAIILYIYIYYIYIYILYIYILYYIYIIYIYIIYIIYIYIYIILYIYILYYIYIYYNIYIYYIYILYYIYNIYYIYYIIYTIYT